MSYNTELNRFSDMNEMKDRDSTLLFHSVL